MACKLIIFTGLLAVARGGILSGNIVGASVPLTVSQPAGAVLRTEDYDHNPQYSFSYSVADGLTGDNKAQEETRNGDVVQGSYSLVEPDGTRRTVSYNADPINGFNAVVQKDPIVSVKTSVAAGPLVASAPGPILRQAVVAPQQQIVRQQLYASGAPAVVAAGHVPLIHGQGLIASAPGLRQTVIAGAPQQYLRQSVIAAPSITSSNIISAPAINGAVVGASPLGIGLGYGTNALYGAQSVIASNYGPGTILKVH